METFEHEYWHVPPTPNGAGLVLTHGAGANCRAPMLVKIAEAFCSAGVRVLRTDMDFRRKRAGGPPSPATGTADRASLREAVAQMRAAVPGPVWLAGHSYGGRQSTMLAAEEPGLVNGLVLFSYPLHPPGHPEKARTAHFPALQTRAIFVHGTKDDFGSVEEMRTALALIPVPPELMIVDGAGHDLKRGAFDLAAMIRLCGI